MRNSAAQLQRLARDRADDQARRIPWPRLLDARNQYIAWQEFYLWVHSILAVEERIPEWLSAPGPALLEWHTQLKAPREVGAIPRPAGIAQKSS